MKPQVVKGCGDKAAAGAMQGAFASVASVRLGQIEASEQAAMRPRPKAGASVARGVIGGNEARRSPSPLPLQYQGEIAVLKLQ